MFKTSYDTLCGINPEPRIGRSSGLYIYGDLQGSIGNMIFTHYVNDDMPPFPIIEMEFGWQYFLLGKINRPFGEKLKFASIEKYKLEDIIKKLQENV